MERSGNGLLVFVLFLFMVISYLHVFSLLDLYPIHWPCATPNWPPVKQSLLSPLTDRSDMGSENSLPVHANLTPVSNDNLKSRMPQHFQPLHLRLVTPYHLPHFNRQ